jgi:hypothetical protein
VRDSVDRIDALRADEDRFVQETEGRICTGRSGCKRFVVDSEFRVVACGGMYTGANTGERPTVEVGMVPVRRKN